MSKCKLVVNKNPRNLCHRYPRNPRFQFSVHSCSFVVNKNPRNLCLIQLVIALFSAFSVLSVVNKNPRNLCLILSQVVSQVCRNLSSLIFSQRSLRSSAVALPFYLLAAFS